MSEKTDDPEFKQHLNFQSPFALPSSKITYFARFYYISGFTVLELEFLVHIWLWLYPSISFGSRDSKHIIYFSHYKTWRILPFKRSFLTLATASTAHILQQYQRGKGAGFGLRTVLRKKISTFQDACLHRVFLKGPRMMWSKPIWGGGPFRKT